MMGWNQKLASSMLRLELLCGSNHDPEHDAYFDPGEGCLPQYQIQQELQQHGIEVRIQPTTQGITQYSDAYVDFRPDQIELVAQVIRKANWRGDILDGLETLDPQTAQYIEQIAQREGWEVEF
jgi:hypothetical protein